MVSRALQIEQTLDCQSQEIAIVSSGVACFGGSHATSYTPLWHPVSLVTCLCHCLTNKVKGCSIPTNYVDIIGQIIIAIGLWLTSDVWTSMALKYSRALPPTPVLPAACVWSSHEAVNVPALRDDRVSYLTPASPWRWICKALCSLLLQRHS